MFPFSYSALVKEKQVKKGNLVLESCNKEEVTLIVLANIILAVGIIASIISIFIIRHPSVLSAKSDKLLKKNSRNLHNAHTPNTITPY